MKEYLTREQVNDYVLQYQKTKDEKILNLLYEEFKGIAIYIIKKKFYYTNHEDLIQEYAVILEQTMMKYQQTEGYNFKSYLIHHLLYYCMEALRTKYFNVVKIPQKKYNKEEFKFKKIDEYEEDKYGELIECYENDIVQKIDSINISNCILERLSEKFSNNEQNIFKLNLFLKINGIGYKKYTYQMLKEETGIATSTLHRYVKKIKSMLETDKFFIDLKNKMELN